MSAPPARILLLALACAAVAVGAGGAAPPPNVLVTPPGGQIHGGRLALDPRHPDRLAAVYWDERREQRGTCAIATSSNGGKTWSNRSFAGVGNGNFLPSGATLCRNPAVAFGPDGTLYVVYEVARLSGFAQVELARSTDAGATFGSPRLLDPDAAGGGDREPTIAVGRRAGQVYVSFQRYTADEESADVHVVSSADGGRTVSSTPVSPPAQNAAGSRAALAVDPAGTLYAAWVDASGVELDGGGRASLEVASSQAGGRSFGAPTTIAEAPAGCGPNGDCGNRYPALAIAAPARKRVVAAWSGAAFPDPSRISMARSSDGGRRWTSPRALPAPAGAGDPDPYGPELAAAPDARLDLAYLEQARDADIGRLDVDLAHSVDGGKTFSAPVKVDDVPSATQRGDFEPAAAVRSSNAFAAAAWIDGRRGNTGAATTDVVVAVRPDSAAPKAPLVRGALVVRSGRTAVYRLSSRDAFTPVAALRYRCAFDGGRLRPCPARVALRLSPGRHALRAQAVDAAGNRSPVTRTFVLALRPIPEKR